MAVSWLAEIEGPDLDRLRARDHGAFELLAERHYTPVRRYLARLTGDAEAAADLAQETFLRAYLALPRLADASELGAWLFRIATNLARQRHRRGQLIGWIPLENSDGTQSAALNVQGGQSQGFEDAVIREDLVRRALLALPMEHRACLLLYAWAGYTCAEIGEMVGKSTDAVRMILVRARRQFRDAYLDGNGSSGGTTNTRRRGGPGEVHGSHPAIAGAGIGLAEGPGTEGCSGVDEALTFFPRGDVPLDELTAITHHLNSCGACHASLLEVQALYRTLQAHLFTAVVDRGAPPAAASVLSRVKLAVMAMEAELPVEEEVRVPVLMRR
jgi:RNA polymerase sigma-70 factor, ECF subfamily